MATRYDPQHHEREVLDTALKALGELTGIDGKVVAIEARTSPRASGVGHHSRNSSDESGQCRLSRR